MIHFAHAIFLSFVLAAVPLHCLGEGQLKDMGTAMLSPTSVSTRHVLLLAQEEVTRDSKSDQDVALEAVKAGEALKLEEILACAGVGKRCLDARLFRKNGRFIHEIDALQADQFHKVRPSHLGRELLIPIHSLDYLSWRQFVSPKGSRWRLFS